MHGNGTKLDIIPNNPKAFCLDVTRLVRRSGRVFTGVDRVEWAYLDWCLSLDRDVFGLMRSSFGYLLLDRSGLLVLREHVREATWPTPDLLSRLALGMSPDRRGAETALRKVAMARATPGRLARMLRTALPGAFVYFNTGHSNLTRRVFGAMRSHGSARSVILVHDMIPLTHPQFQKAGTVEKFEARMRLVSQFADAVICNSEHTRRETETVFSGFGRMPLAVVAHLGSEIPQAGPVSPHVPSPYFVTVGTLEPRKNHALLLDVWDAWSADGTPPHLVICGHRGWASDAFFRRLDRMKASGAPIVEFNGLADDQMLALVGGAQAALFPSHAEGFGLPQVEAAQLGVPIICGDLDIYREILGDLPVYVGVNDPYPWRQAIEKMLHSDSKDRDRVDVPRDPFDAPDWESHFNRVLKEFG